MKKVLAVLLLILLCALWGCSKQSEAETNPVPAQSGEQTPAAEPSASGTDAETKADEVDPAVAAVTPVPPEGEPLAKKLVTPTTTEGILAFDGIIMLLPAEAEDPEWTRFYYDAYDDAVNEVTFRFEDTLYCWRSKLSTGFDDISGMPYIFGEHDDTRPDDTPRMYNHALARWYADGVSYALFTPEDLAGQNAGDGSKFMNLFEILRNSAKS